VGAGVAGPRAGNGAGRGVGRVGCSPSGIANANRYAFSVPPKRIWARTQVRAPAGCRTRQPEPQIGSSKLQMRLIWHREAHPDPFGTALGKQIVHERQNPFGATENLQDRERETAKPPQTEARDRRVDRETRRITVTLGLAVRDERLRRRLTLSDVADLSGSGLTTVHDVECGRVGSLETYVRLADALRLKADFVLVDPRRREPAARRATDPVHAAMGESEAAHLCGLGLTVGLDEPFQHFQFAGRADAVAWSVERRALLHIENKTRFVDLQDSFGSFNAKRRYLGAELAARAGIARWRSESHVIAALWSGEVLRAIRLHAASFASVCPDPADAFEAWWRGEPPATGRHSILVVFDPAEGRRRDRRRWLALSDLAAARPRYRDYAAAVDLGLGNR
jgi:Helix-turn-helix domain